MGMGLIPELEAVEESLEEGLGFETHLLDLVGREVFEFFIGFLAVPDPDGIGLGGVTVGLDGVQVFRAERDLDVDSPHGGDDLIGGDPFENHDQEVKAFRTGRNHQAGEVRLDAEVPMVELGPTAEEAERVVWFSRDVGRLFRSSPRRWRDKQLLGEFAIVVHHLQNIGDVFGIAISSLEKNRDLAPQPVRSQLLSLVVISDHGPSP